MTIEQRFFNRPTRASLKKIGIVSDYFGAWSNVIANAARHTATLTYLDLMSGPGRYDDGTPSTPIRIIERAIENPNLRDRLVAIFNDSDAAFVAKLRREIRDIPGVEKLRHQPRVFDFEVDREILSRLPQLSGPTLSYVDPWGYKELSLSLLERLLQPWGSDCFFLFNYRRFNAALSCNLFRDLIDRLLGPERADELRRRVLTMPPQRREMAVLAELRSALGSIGGAHLQDFRFVDEVRRATSHYVFLVSKHPKGIGMIKNIMAKQSSSFDQGVPSYTHDVTEEQQPMLFSADEPLEKLKESLGVTFRGRTLTVGEIIDLHHSGTPYLERNYRDALRQMETAGRISIDPPAADRRTRGGVITLPVAASVTFRG